MSKISEISRAFSDRFARRGRKRRQSGGPALATIERLESRLALFSPFPIQVAPIASGSGPNNGLEILFSQGGGITADQHVVIDIDRVFPALGTPQTRVNVYASTNPAANSSQFGTAYTNIDYIRVVVPNYDVAGTNNNSFTLKGMALPSDRIIISGSGRTSAGRWSDESGSELQIAFDIEGIDDTTVIAGGVINVSGAFTNDTLDASIHAIGEVAERSRDQQTGTVIVGQTTPTPIDLPQPRLYSDYVQIIGAELDIYSTIVATHQVILRAAESAPGDARANLVLPYDITVTDTTDGIVELHSTRNITQLQSSTITARKLVAVSNNSNPIPPGTGLDGNAWNIDLGSVNNDFDEIAVGMIAAPGDEPNKATQGRIGVRDIDDLTVADFGILASTGMVTLRAGGQLDINSAIQATGLTAQSNFGIASSAAGILKIGDLGITIDAANTAASATGDVALNGRITVGSGDFTKGPDTKIRSRGTTTIAGGISSPQKGTLLVEADEGIVIDAPVQFGSTQLDVNSTTATVFVGDIRLVSNGIGSAGITVRNKPGNEGVPQTLRASEGISLESTGDILVEGAVLAGSLYGNPSNLTETAALPSITVKTAGTGSVSLSSTGSLQTVAYETNPGKTTNPLVGLISISGASQVTTAGGITADGAVSIAVVGDVSLAGPTTARENVNVATTTGSIDVQGAVYSKGGTYTTDVVAGSQRVPNVILAAPNGSISTSNLGTLRAGTAAGSATIYGTVILTAQQDIEIGAAIDTDGGVDASTKLGSFNLSGLLRTANAQTAKITAAKGVIELEFGRIDSGSLDVTNTTEGDITLLAVDNRIAALTAQNFALGGVIEVANNADLAATTVAANGAVTLTSTSTVTLTNAAADAITVTANGLVSLVGDINAKTGGIVAKSISGGIDLRANLYAENHAVTLLANSGVIQANVTGVSRIELLNRGRLVSDAPQVSVTIAAPEGGGQAASGYVLLQQIGTTLVTTTTTNLDGSTSSVTVDTPVWQVQRVVITSPGAGYVINESPKVTFFGISGVLALAVTRSFDTAVVAHKGLTVTAGLDVSLSSPFRSETGNVLVTSSTGSLSLDADTFVVQALAGDVTLTSGLGYVAVQRIDAANDVAITATTGEARVFQGTAGKNITVSAGGKFTLMGVLDSKTGDVSAVSRSRDLDFTAAGAQIYAPEGGVILSSPNGSILSPPTLNVGKNASLTSFNTLVLNNEITSDTGVISLTSTSGSINLGANINAHGDSVQLSAKGSVTQVGGGIGYVSVLTGGSGYTTSATVTIAAPASGTGVAARAMPVIATVNGVPGVIVGIRLLTPGSGYGAGERPAVTFTRNATPPTGVTYLEAAATAVAAPALGNSGLAAIDVLDGGSGYGATTTVTVAAPAGGGTAATAQAVIGTVVNDDGTTTNGVIVGIVIDNPGSGYGAGERPAVTIAGAGTGAAATAIAAITLQDIRADNDIEVLAGGKVTLLNTIRANQGHVKITSETGNVNLAARTLLVSSFQDDIEITARRGSITTQRLAADGNITLNSQTGVTLLNAVNSRGEFGTGDVSIKTTNGNIAAVAPNGLISVQNGGVSLESVNGTIFVPQVFNVSGDISLRTYASQAITSQLTAGGAVTVASSGGAVAIRANIFAADRVTLGAKLGITQTNPILAKELVARNTTSTAITLNHSRNDVDNFAAHNLTGDVTFNDADGFETGVNRVGTLGVEIVGANVQLTSGAPYSTIRVVSGLQYRTLAIGAGNVNGASVGTVEFVPTAAGDNPAAAGLTPTFVGTLRDMIRYINDNTAVYVANQMTRSQPMAVVFDEAGYAVDTITVAATLPTFNRAVTFDGGRLEESVLLVGETRLNITQGLTALPYGLSFAPAIPAAPGKAPAYPGSAGSSIQHVAMYGFKKGSALVLASGNNTVTDFYAGIRADGTADATTRNLVGLDVTGVAASNNRIGSTVFDAATANRFGGNTSAGILIRNGAAGTRVYGSVIGDDTGSTPLLANGDGIRISASTGNVIGTPDATQPDQTDSVSNLIVGNSGNGVAIVNAVAGTTAAANVVRNNLISGNKVGVFLSASKFAAIGGANGESGNTIISQKGDGVAIANSTDVQILGNRIGISPTTDFVAESLAGNAGNGVSIAGTSQRVQIASGNRMSANTLNGVSIGTGATAVTITGNTIGGVLDDGFTGAGNGFDGVVITAAIGNTVGAGNVISRNGRNGVSVIDARAMALAAGNRITGSTVTGNALNGVYVSGGSGSTVGGTTVTDGNVIQANGKSGVYLEQSSKTGPPTGYVIQRNFIGTNTNRDVDSDLGNLSGGIVVNDGTGVRVESNVVMNNRWANDSVYANDPNDGITVRGGAGNVIGGIAVAQGNLVANNQRDGIRIVGPTVARPAVGHWVTGNTVTNNGSNGVTVADGFARNIAVGQSVTSAGVRGLGNLIRQNAAFGVTVTGNAQQVSIQGNSIAANVSGGISISVGSNTSTAAGISLTKATIRQPMGSQLQVLLQGSLTGAVKGQQYSIDVYANSPQDSNYGGYHGRRFLGRVTVTATVDGTITWGANNPLAISANVAVGEFITASVTALRIEPGSSSKLSAGVQATR